MKYDFKEFLRNVKEYEFSRKINMNELAKNFLEGLLLLVPVAMTIYVVIFVFEIIDGWLNIPIPFVGFAITIGMIILVGRLASTVFVQGALRKTESVLTRTPFVKLLYTSIKDLIEAFVGEKKRFDQPVAVKLTSDGHIEALGFVTRRHLDFLGLHDRVAVYFPQSYNFAGNLLLFPQSQVRELKVESSEVMAFIVSGGISGGLTGEVPVAASTPATASQ